MRFSKQQPAETVGQASDPMSLMEGVNVIAEALEAAQEEVRYENDSQRARSLRRVVKQLRTIHDLGLVDDIAIVRYVGCTGNFDTAMLTRVHASDGKVSALEGSLEALALLATQVQELVDGPASLRAVLEDAGVREAFARRDLETAYALAIGTPEVMDQLSPIRAR